jgi:hypothetical protein
MGEFCPLRILRLRRSCGFPHRYVTKRTAASRQSLQKSPITLVLVGMPCKQFDALSSKPTVHRVTSIHHVKPKKLPKRIVLTMIMPASIIIFGRSQSRLLLSSDTCGYLPVPPQRNHAAIAVLRAFALFLRGHGAD